jgi:hypothetical protein
MAPMNKLLAYLSILVILYALVWCFASGIQGAMNVQVEPPPREITPRAYSLEGRYNYRTMCWRCHVKHELVKQGLWPEKIHKEAE